MVSLLVWIFKSCKVLDFESFADDVKSEVGLGIFGPG